MNKTFRENALEHIFRAETGKALLRSLYLQRLCAGGTPRFWG